MWHVYFSSMATAGRGFKKFPACRKLDSKVIADADVGGISPMDKCSGMSLFNALLQLILFFSEKD